jgi:23S rRNA (cytosine1962-C5)-methyltransferase
MSILISPEWPDYELLDTGNRLRLERFGKYRLIRPDPQIIWKPHLDKSAWDLADAVFGDAKEARNHWTTCDDFPDKWLLHYKNLAFWAKLTPFKHTGIFPEQTAQWEWLKQEILVAGHQLNILNLFAYTGAASLVAASCGAKVTHLDASQPAINWAKDNQTASSLSNKPIRWILDDAAQFTRREIKRGVLYDGIIMDPPAYGHSPNGKSWDFSRDFAQLLNNCLSLLSKQPAFILINAYAISASSIMLENVLNDIAQNLRCGKVEAGELALRESGSGRLLSTGIFGRWTAN